MPHNLRNPSPRLLDHLMASLLSRSIPKTRIPGKRDCNHAPVYQLNGQGIFIDVNLLRTPLGFQLPSCDSGVEWLFGCLISVKVRIVNL